MAWPSRPDPFTPGTRGFWRRLSCISAGATGSLFKRKFHMHILKIEANSNTASTKLDDWGTVGLPLSEPACQLRGAKIVAPITNAPEIGVWECFPGQYRRQILSA